MQRSVHAQQEQSSKFLIAPCVLCSLFTLVLFVCRAAWIDKCRPDILISESTYATTIRDSKRCRERDFLKKVHETIERGGKVRVTVSQMYLCERFLGVIERKFIFIFLRSLFEIIFPGSHSSVCPRESARTLHPVGNILVCCSSGF